MKIINKNFQIEKDILGNGYFVKYIGEATSSLESEFAEFEDYDNILCSYRNNPWFNDANVPKSFEGVTYETQWLCHRDKNGTYTVLYPLVEEPLRASFFGKKDNVLSIYIESGDAATEATDKVVVYYAQGRNFYELIDKAPDSIANRLKTCTTKKVKRVPEIYNYFGWCTWDSFYEHVSADDIKSGLQSFKNGGFVPGFLLLDDGWQTVCEDYEDRGLHKLSKLCANAKFNNDLAEIVRFSKENYGIKQFYVWHAMLGYWGGLEPNSPDMKKYGVKYLKKRYSDRLKSIAESSAEEILGVPDPDKAFDFYNDYHRYLSGCGVDGVKVDVQFNLEAIGENNGGRVRITRKYREALEASINLNFNGGLINCMCGSNDLTYHFKASAIARTSGDYLPNVPDSHGVHIFKNAVNSLWIGGFVYCDWDMFQTKHECGDFHASARAISGSPVYVSDKVDEHDFEIIAKLTTSDGRLLMAEETARPTYDSLFTSPNDKDLYKIFNYNKFGGVIGIFNLTSQKEEITKEVKPFDIPAFTSGKYVLYHHNKKIFEVKDACNTTSVTLNGIKSEIITVMPIEDGFCAVGLCDKYNTGAAVRDVIKADSETVVNITGGGSFAFYSEKAVTEVQAAGKSLGFTQKEENIYETVIDSKEKVELRVKY